MEDKHIIDMIGGTSKVAEICGLTTGAVSQWRKNGVPKYWTRYLRLLRPDVFEQEDLKKKSRVEVSA